MARITVEDCESFVDNRFRLVTLAAFRTRQLLNGDKPKLEPKDDEKKTVVALREIGAGVLSLDDLQEGLINRFCTVNADLEEDFDDLEGDTYSPLMGLEVQDATSTSAVENRDHSSDVMDKGDGTV